ncbi:MAG: hypothetical protein IPP22_04385 [Nitrosomonas sp.]|nr:hypothetical protein [Nitrosomonas sp.]
MEGLIVEPSRTYQKLLSSAIESGGLETKQVSTGNEALTLLKNSLLTWYLLQCTYRTWMAQSFRRIFVPIRAPLKYHWL